MANTGTDYGAWTGLTSTVSTSISGIAFNTAISSLKTFTTTDVTRMNQAAENKVTDDQNQANAK